MLGLRCRHECIPEQNAVYIPIETTRIPDKASVRIEGHPEAPKDCSPLLNKKRGRVSHTLSPTLFPLQSVTPSRYHHLYIVKAFLQCAFHSFLHSAPNGCQLQWKSSGNIRLLPSGRVPVRYFEGQGHTGWNRGLKSCNRIVSLFSLFNDLVWFRKKEFGSGISVYFYITTA